MASSRSSSNTPKNSTANLGFEAKLWLAADDSVLRPLFEQYPGLKVVVCPEEVMDRAKMRFLVKVLGLEEGPYSETEVLKLIETGRIDRTAACRRAKDEEWKTVGEHLPPQEHAQDSGGVTKDVAS